MTTLRVPAAAGLAFALLVALPPARARAQGRAQASSGAVAVVPYAGFGEASSVRSMPYGASGGGYTLYAPPTPVHPWLRRHGITRTPPDAKPSYAGGYGYEYNNIPPRFEFPPTRPSTTPGYAGGYGYEYNNLPGGFLRGRAGRGAGPR